MHLKSIGWKSELMVRHAAGSEIEDHGDWLVVRTPGSPSFWWGNYLLAPDPVKPGQAALWRARFDDAFPAARHFALGIDDPSGDPGDAQELIELGVEVDVSTVLSALPHHVTASTSAAQPPPTDIEVRALAVDDDWRRLLQLRHECDTQEVPADGIDAHHGYLRKQVLDDRLLVETGQAAWLGAFENGRLAASLGLVFDTAGHARYQTVETSPSHRRQGLARALVIASARIAPVMRATTSLTIIADPSYHAIDLYRSLGFIDTGHLVQLQAGGF